MITLKSQLLSQKCYITKKDAKKMSDQAIASFCLTGATCNLMY